MAAVQFPSKKTSGAVQFPKKQSAASAKPTREQLQAMSFDEQKKWRDLAYQEQTARGVRPEDVVDPVTLMPGGIPDAPAKPVPTTFERATGDLSDFTKEALGSPITGVAKAGFGAAQLPEVLTPLVEDDVRYFTGNTLSNEEAAKREEFYKAYFRPLHEARDWTLGHLHEPTSDFGKAMQTLGEFAIGGWPSRATRAAPTWSEVGTNYAKDVISNVAAPAAFSELAGRATEGTPYEGVARLFGGFAGNVGGWAARSLRSIPRILQDATRNMTPEQWAEALRVAALQRNPRYSTRLTGPEAVSEATGGASPLTNVQRYVEGDPIWGRGVMGPFMADRPRQLAQDAELVAASVAPQAAEPTRLGFRAQEAANDVTRGAMNERSAQQQPSFTAANPQLVPRAEMDQLLAEIEAEIARDPNSHRAGVLRGYRDQLIDQPAQPAVAPRPTGVLDAQGNPVMTPGAPAQPAVPKLDIERLDTARKFFRDQLGLPIVDANRAAHIGNEGRLIGDYNARLNELMRRNPDFARGQDIHAQATRDVVQPVSEGPIGQVQQAGTTEGALAALMPDNPMPGVANQLYDAIMRLRNASPAAARDIPALIAQGVRNKFSKAMTATQEGVQEWAGAKFNKDAAGNPAKRQALEAQIGAAIPVPGAGPALQTLDDVLTMFRATGRRKQVGSATEFNRTLTDEMGTDPAVGAAELAGSLGRSWPTMLRDTLSRAVQRSNVRNLAELFTDPRSVERIRQISMGAPAFSIPEMITRGGLQGLTQYYGISKDGTQPR